MGIYSMGPNCKEEQIMGPREPQCIFREQYELQEELGKENGYTLLSNSFYVISCIIVSVSDSQCLLPESLHLLPRRCPLLLHGAPSLWLVTCLSCGILFFLDSTVTGIQDNDSALCLQPKYKRQILKERQICQNFVLLSGRSKKGINALKPKM